jgi:hypothetical protein
MTTPNGVIPAAHTGVTPAAPPRIVPQPHTPLHELLGQREAAKAAVAEAEARLEAISSAIKNLVTQANPGIAVFDIAGDANIAPLRLAWRTPQGLDTDRFKTEQREMYRHYLIWKKPYWELRPVKS